MIWQLEALGASPVHSSILNLRQKDVSFILALRGKKLELRCSVTINVQDYMSNNL